MSQMCNRCYKIVHRACQNDTEAAECPKLQRKPRLAAAIAAQEKWIEQCGGSRAGYVARYGAKNDPDRYGDGGEAIYVADMAELVRLRLAAKAFAKTK